MSAGDLDQRITLQREVRVPDGGGGYDLTWSDIATVWAGVTPLSGREQLLAQKEAGITLYRIRMYRRDDVDPATRILWNGRALNVREVLDAGPRALFMELTAEAGGGT